MLNYHVVYDATANPYSPWRLGLAFLICAIALIIWRRSMKAPQAAVRHWMIRAGILIVAALAVVAATYEPASRAQLRQAIDNKQSQTVEGVISDYTPGDPAKRIPEHFTVQAQDASHFTFILRPSSPGFHETQASGSPLKAGECVRLSVIGGAIGKLEIADSCQR